MASRSHRYNVVYARADTPLILAITIQKMHFGYHVHDLRTLLLCFYLFSCIFILLSRESDQCAIRARLGVAGHLSTTPRWGNPAKCLFQCGGNLGQFGTTLSEKERLRKKG